MIIKIMHSNGEKEFTIIDNIKNITVNKKEEIIVDKVSQPYYECVVSDKIIEHYYSFITEPEYIDKTMNIIKLDLIFNNNRDPISVYFDFHVYICDDSGKTIESITANKLNPVKEMLKNNRKSDESSKEKIKKSFIEVTKNAQSILSCF